MNFKKCSTCKEYKPLSEFHKDSSRKDGIDYHCKSCKSARAARRYEEKREEILEQQSQYRKEHIAEKAIYDREYYLKHRDRIRARNRKYYDEHPAQMAAYHAEYYEINREELMSNHIEYFQTPRGRAVQTAARLRRRVAMNGESIAAQDIEEIKQEYAGLCPYCNEVILDDGHVDHIIPVSYGGDNRRANLVYCCADCNRRKSNKSLLEFMLYKKWLWEYRGG